MRKEIKDEKDLQEAIKRCDSQIELTGDLAHRIVRLRITGRLAWFVAIIAIMLGIYGIWGEGSTASPLPAETSAHLAAQVDPALTTAPWPLSLLISLLAGALGFCLRNKLRRYRLVQKDPNKVILIRKK